MAITKQDLQLLMTARGGTLADILDAAAALLVEELVSADVQAGALRKKLPGVARALDLRAGVLSATRGALVEGARGLRRFPRRAAA